MTSSKSSFYFDTWCGCISLKTGCFISAYMGLVGVVIASVALAVVVGARIVASKTDKYYEITPLMISIACVLFFVLILTLAFNIVLLVGLHKNKPGYVKAFLNYNTIFLVVYAIFLVISIFAGITNIQTILSRIVQILISIYFLLVFRSYYHEMKGASNQQV